MPARIVSTTTIHVSKMTIVWNTRITLIDMFQWVLDISRLLK